MYPNKHTTMQTRSQTRQSNTIATPNTNTYQIQTRASARKASTPLSSPREEPANITFLDAEFTEYDSSSDYDPNEEYSVDIDFDEAATAWRANKRSTGNGCFQYVKNAFQEPKNTGCANAENTHSMRLRSRA